MAKYNSDIINKIISLREKPEYRVIDICKEVGISEALYYEWKKEKVEFLEALKKSETKRFESIGSLAENSLIRKITGFEVEEEIKDIVIDDTGKESIKFIRKIKKYIPPSDTAIIFCLKNTLEKQYKDRMVQAHEGEIKVKRLLDD